MKRTIASYFIVGTLLAASAAGTIRVFGQGGPNRKPNDGPIVSGFYLPSFNQSIPPQGPPPGQYTSPGYALPNQPMVANNYPMQNGNIHHVFILKEDGNFELIERGQGAPYNPEDMQQIIEAKQKLQNALSQIRSSDANESTKKEAKGLVAKYLKAEFKADQDSRREHVERLEKQVEQLKKQLTKRNESQDKLIELRMQLLENDATGLSFPDAWGNLAGPQHVGGFPPAIGYPVGPQFPNSSPIQSFPVQATPSPNVPSNPNSIPPNLE